MKNIKGRRSIHREITMNNQSLKQKDNSTEFHNKGQYTKADNGLRDRRGSSMSVEDFEDEICNNHTMPDENSSDDHSEVFGDSFKRSDNRLQNDLPETVKNGAHMRQTKKQNYVMAEKNLSSNNSKKIDFKSDFPTSAATNLGPKYRPESHDEKNSSKNNVACAALVVLVLSALALAWQYVAGTSGSTNTAQSCSFKDLRRQYPQQDDLVWNSLTTTVDNIISKRSRSPSVFLFVHQKDEQLDKLVKNIASQTSACFEQGMSPIEMRNEDFTSAQAKGDYGHVIEMYKAKIKNRNVILIANLNKIPAEAARALHTICETYSPYKEGVIILLTLVTPQQHGRALDNAEKTLRNLWGSALSSNELDPLIARVTEQVILLKSA